MSDTNIANLIEKTEHLLKLHLENTTTRYSEISFQDIKTFQAIAKQAQKDKDTIEQISKILHNKDWNNGQKVFRIDFLFDD